MQPESSRAASAEPNGTQCPSCKALMPQGMRFCRACGYRLGEGVEEYVETVRLNASAKGRGAATAAAPDGKTNPFQPAGWGAMAQPLGVQQLGVKPSTGLSRWSCTKGFKSNWMVWMIIAIVIMSVVGGGLMTPFALRNRGNMASSAARSYAGVSDFSSADGGAFLNYVTPPGGPADKAGLLGGDVITSFDGKPVKGEDDIRRLLRSTPVGKTVEVVFIRDGQTRTTQMTTTSKEEMDRLTTAFKRRPEGIGYIGEGTDLERVIVPGMNIYGVRLDDIRKSQPADMSGLKNGDVVIEFDGVPTRTRRELESRIERAVPYSTVKAIVIRNGERVEVPIKVGIDD